MGRLVHQCLVNLELIIPDEQERMDMDLDWTHHGASCHAVLQLQ